MSVIEAVFDCNAVRDPGVDPRWVLVGGKWYPRVARGQIWQKKFARYTVSILGLSPERDQPQDLRDGTRRWVVLDSSPMPRFREGRRLSEALLWDGYELV